VAEDLFVDGEGFLVDWGQGGLAIRSFGWHRGEKGEREGESTSRGFAFVFFSFPVLLNLHF